MVEFSQELFDSICERIAEGESGRAIMRDKETPSLSTFWKWLKEPELAKQYARAKQEQADAIFEDCLDIADNATLEETQLARMRIDTRKWMAGKLRPKVYGDKLTQDNISSDGTFAPRTVIIKGAE